MKTIKVVSSPVTGKVYIARYNKGGTEILDKREALQEVVEAVVHHMVTTSTEQLELTAPDGSKAVLTLSAAKEEGGTDSCTPSK